MQLMSYEPSTLAIHVGIVALASLGQVEWLKNWVDCPEEKKRRRRLYSSIGLMALAINVIMQMPFIHNTATWGWNLFALGQAFMQFGHAALVKLPEALLNKAMGGQNVNSKQN